MRSIADVLRGERRSAEARLTPVERIALALRLGDDDAVTLAAARGIPPARARAVIRRSRSLGRPPSCAAEPPHGASE